MNFNTIPDDQTYLRPKKATTSNLKGRLVGAVVLSLVIGACLATTGTTGASATIIQPTTSLASEPAPAANEKPAPPAPAEPAHAPLSPALHHQAGLRHVSGGVHLRPQRRLGHEAVMWRWILPRGGLPARRGRRTEGHGEGQRPGLLRRRRGRGLPAGNRSCLWYHRVQGLTRSRLRRLQRPSRSSSSPFPLYTKTTPFPQIPF